MSSERQLLEGKSPWWGEHVHRYEEILSHLKGSEVILDLACGTGFGSDILANHTTKTVIGGDIDKTAISECQMIWSKKNLSFQVLDGTKLPFGEGYFDVIVSFETIEHTTQYQAMLREFFRVLKPEGVAFISTPNFVINSPSGKVTNPYHTQEFTYIELKNILSGIFPQVTIKGQYYNRYIHKNIRNWFGKYTESLLLMRGVRKLPINLQDKIMGMLIGKPIYPLATDYEMNDSTNIILQCKTFFAICRK